MAEQDKKEQDLIKKTDNDSILKNTIKITFKTPITFDGKEVTELTMMKPKIKHQLKADKGNGTAAEKEVKLFAILCKRTIELIEELYLEDYLQLQEVFRNFLGIKELPLLENLEK